MDVGFLEHRAPRRIGAPCLDGTVGVARSCRSQGISGRRLPPGKTTSQAQDVFNYPCVGLIALRAAAMSREPEALRAYGVWTPVVAR